MLRIRVIPTLLLQQGSLVKTVRFKTPTYIGESVNTVRIFNELEVDELVFLDIEATKLRRGPDFRLLDTIAGECFMPLAYGGGIRSVDDIKTILSCGVEKVLINSYAFENPGVITQAAAHFGRQAIIGSIDVKRHFLKGYQVHTVSGTKNTGLDPVTWAKQLELLGVGEILLTSIDREGTSLGFDIDLIRSVTEAVNVPVIAHGGAGSIAHMEEAVKRGGASAIGLGSMVVYQKKGLGVLINFPDKDELAKRLK